MSNFSWFFFRNNSAEILIIFALSALKEFLFCTNLDQMSLSFSRIVDDFAFLDKASKDSDPVPANRSRQVFEVKSCCSQLNKVSLTLPSVGLKSSLSKKEIFLRFQLPPTILVVFFLTLIYPNNNSRKVFNFYLFLESFFNLVRSNRIYTIWKGFKVIQWVIIKSHHS